MFLCTSHNFLVETWTLEIVPCSNSGISSLPHLPPIQDLLLLLDSFFPLVVAYLISDFPGLIP